MSATDSIDQVRKNELSAQKYRLNLIFKNMGADLGCRLVSFADGPSIVCARIAVLSRSASPNYFFLLDHELFRSYGFC